VTEPEFSSELDDIRKRYSTQYRLNWQDYGYRWHPRNKQSIYYRQAQERAVVGLFNAAGVHLGGLRILDLGCGNGGFLRFLTSLGADPDRLTGCDLLLERVREARRLNPIMGHVCSDATHLPFAGEDFDLVSQFTVFSSTSRAMQRALAREMVRILKPGGQILWYDMRGPFPPGPLTGIEREDLRALFYDCQIQALEPLHATLSPRLLRFGYLVAEVADAVPGLRRSHYLALVRKPAD
jgi:SAM-dependent methyltransferase